MSRGVPIKTRRLPISANRDGTLEPHGDIVLSPEVAVDTPSLTYPLTQATKYVSRVNIDDWRNRIPLPPAGSQPEHDPHPDKGSVEVFGSGCPP